MAEMYTKPFESVQEAITLFEQRIESKEYSTIVNREETEEEILKDLTYCRPLLEANEHEKSLFYEFDASAKSPEEFLMWLKLHQAERDKYKEKFRKAQSIFLEFEKGEPSFHSFGNLKPVEDLHFKQQFTAADELRTTICSHSEMMKQEVSAEKKKGHEAKNYRGVFVAGIEKYLHVPEEEALQLKIHLVEFLKRQLDDYEDPKYEISKQKIIYDYLHMDLDQSKDAQVIFSKALLSATSELNLVKSENEPMKQINSVSVNFLSENEEIEKIMKKEFNVSLKKMHYMNRRTEILVDVIRRLQREMSNSKQELEFQANGTAPMTKLHNSSSRIAAAKVAQAESTQVMQQLAVETEEIKTGVQRLDEFNKTVSEKEAATFNKKSADIATGTDITFSMADYDHSFSSFLNSGTVDDTKRESIEFNKLKIELQNKNAEISELKCKLEETARRAELAENARLAMENQLTKLMAQQQLRGDTSRVLKDLPSMKQDANRHHEKFLLSKLSCIKSEPHDTSPPKRRPSVDHGKLIKYIPLSKFLKIKLSSS